MKSIFWIAIVVVFMTAGGFARAQGDAKDFNSLPPLHDPAVVAATEAREKQSNLLRQQAKEALKKGDTAKAIDLFEQAVKAFEIDTQSRIFLTDIYIKQGKNDDVIRILRPLFYHDTHIGYSDEHEITVRMKYVLALLAKNRWAEAVTIYEESFAKEGATTNFGESRNGELKWQLPGGGPEHTLPEVHFSIDDYNISGLSAQAHLILGSREPADVEYEVRAPYMLAHLKQALKYDRFSLDAQFLSGILLAKMERFDEARTAFKQAARLAPDSAQLEIAAALKDLKVQEEQKKARDAAKAVQGADAAKQAPQ